MTNGRTKEEYAKFLETPFWIELSARKRQLVGKCERCGTKEWLQAHHKFYRDDWYQTQLGDLEVLCRPCHEKEHGICTILPAIPEVGLKDERIPNGAFAGAQPKPVKPKPKAKWKYDPNDPGWHEPPPEPIPNRKEQQWKFKPQPPSKPTRIFACLFDARLARQRGELTRAEYLEVRKRFDGYKKNPFTQLRKRLNKHQRRRDRAKWRDRGLNFSHRKNWVNRGTSSN